MWTQSFLLFFFLKTKFLILFVIPILFPLFNGSKQEEEAMKEFQVNGSTLCLSLFTDVTNSKLASIPLSPLILSLNSSFVMKERIAQYGKSFRNFVIVFHVHHLFNPIIFNYMEAWLTIYKSNCFTPDRNSFRNLFTCELNYEVLLLLHKFIIMKLFLCIYEYFF